MSNLEQVLAQFSKNHGAEGTSIKYTAINTATVVNQFKDAGFELVAAKAGRTRSATRNGFQTHTLIFRHPSMRFASGDIIPQIVLKNSYDGSSAFKVFFGVFRLVCSNGLVLGETWESARVVHLGPNAVRDAVTAAFKVGRQVERVNALVNAMKSRRLTIDEASDFARKAASLVLPENALIENAASQVLIARRSEDTSDDLWTVFNRVQESCLRGGLQYVSVLDGRTRRNSTRAVRSVTRDLTLNQKLWSLAETYLQGAV